MYFNKSYSDFLSHFFGGAEASHCKVGWPSLLMVASKMLSCKTEQNRLRAFSNRFPMCGLLSPSIESPSGGPEKVSSRQINKIHTPRTCLNLSSSTASYVCTATRTVRVDMNSQLTSLPTQYWQVSHLVDERSCDRAPYCHRPDFPVESQLNC